ncbi:MAG: hypothetical protein PHU75_08335 [Candidatus Nanopelagicales bacterium]|nr:hypothetical protein [Candidatus Nanopelagicales bacterium]
MDESLRFEQDYVDHCYALLASYVAHLEQRIGATTTQLSTGTGQDELEREAMLDNLTHQLRQARASDTRLCFGRIDGELGSHHIGRIGLRDASGDPALIDWRAPNAAPFYQATFANPLGVQLRRRIVLRGRTVTHVEDEVLSDPTLTESRAAAASLDAPRDGRMGDIIATIAADQDAIIRSPLNQLTVVQGGPGTGKTVVALHRAAWLLYTYRDKLARDGVLVVGPSPTFLHYIDQVLPSLGETDVVLLTPGQLVPGIDARQHDADDVAAIKGDLRMAQVVANAVRLRRRIPREDFSITMEDRSVVTISAKQLADAERSVHRSTSFHAGRETFLTRALDSLAGFRARQRGEDASDAEVRRDHVSELVEDRHVRRELNLMWMPIAPEVLVRRLLTDADRLAAAADRVLTSAEQRQILKASDEPWTIDDVPLIDEAAELLGPWDPDAGRINAREAAERRHELAHAAQALDNTDMGGWIDAAGLVGRMGSASERQSVAELAAMDRTWVYGHIVVDEAQELSKMAWRVLARRATRKSMTIVGDVQQTSHPAGARDWEEALGGVRGSMDLHVLTVTYRITQQVADVATALLTAAGGDAPELHPVREGAPVLEHVSLRLSSRTSCSTPCAQSPAAPR